jgi:hypothetical protein
LNGEVLMRRRFEEGANSLLLLADIRRLLDYSGVWL